jgi:hypothetical protein
VFSGGGGGSSAATTAGAGSTTSTGGGGGTAGGGGQGANGGGATQTLTPVPLKPVGGSAGTGLATFGLATGNQPFLDVQTRSLPPAPNGQVYSVWLAINPSKGAAYPVAPLTQAHDRFAIPAVVGPILTKVRAVDIAISSAKALSNEIRAVLQSKSPKLIIREPGSVVLRGKVSRKLRGG